MTPTKSEGHSAASTAAATKAAVPSADRTPGLSWRQFKAILRKDIVMELRTKEMVVSMGVYALLTMVIYQVALSQATTSFDPKQIAGGLLWLAFVFTSMLGLNRSLVHEKDQGCLEALMLSPVDRPIVFLAKATGNLVFIGIVEVLAIPVFGFLFLQEAGSFRGDWWMIPLVVAVGSIGIAGVGTLLATMSVNTKGKDFVLAVLFIPIMYPLLLSVVSATSAAVLGGEGYVAQYWQGVGIAAGYDAIMLAAAYGLYEFIVGV